MPRSRLRLRSDEGSGRHPALALIWAMTKARVIGRDGRLPWCLPAEMQHFHSVTLGKPVIMGRKTFESLPKPLSGRTNIVVSRTAVANQAQVRMARGLDEALDIGAEIAMHDEVEEIMLAGGAELYALALPQADRLYMTLVHADIEGDTFFPDFDLTEFEERERRTLPKDADNAHECLLIMLDRCKAP